MGGDASARGTSNADDRGSTRDRRSRKLWLLQEFASDASLVGEPSCRCYRCGLLLTYETMTVDRVIPGAKKGTYRRNNIRPACNRCNIWRGNQR